MTPSLSKLDRLILEAAAADHRRGKRTTLTTLEIAIDEAGGMRAGSKAISTAAWELARIGLLSTVKPTVTISERGLSAVGAAPVETPVPDVQPAPAPRQPEPPPFAKQPGETNRKLVLRLLDAYPGGVTGKMARDLSGIDLAAALSDMVRRGDLREIEGHKPTVYARHLAATDDARLDVAPAPAAQPDVGPAQEAAPGGGGEPGQVEGCGAEEVVVPGTVLRCDLPHSHEGVHRDFWRDAEWGDGGAAAPPAPVPPAITEMVEAVAGAIAAESPSERLAHALRAVVGNGYSVEIDETEPCGVIIGTPRDGIINVEIVPVHASPDRHIVWISPEGGMGVAFLEAVEAAQRAVEGQTDHSYIDSFRAFVDDVAEALGIDHDRSDDPARTCHDVLGKVRTHRALAYQRIADLEAAHSDDIGALADALSYDGPPEHRTWGTLLDEVRGLVAALRACPAEQAAAVAVATEHADALVAAAVEACGLPEGAAWSAAITEIRAQRAELEAVDEALRANHGAYTTPAGSVQRAEAIADIAESLRRSLDWVLNAIHAGPTLRGTLEGKSLADRWRMVLEEVRERRPVRQIITEARLRREREIDTLSEALRLLGVA